jgi:hypothetical protein
MPLFRIADFTGALFLVALTACATTNPFEDDGGVGPSGPDASKSSADADPADPDAASRPDASPDAPPPPPIDAAVHLPDAAVPRPDAATGCTPTTTNLLQNANFDTGPGAMWTEVGGAGELILAGTALQSHAAHSGTYAAWLGGYNSGDDQLTQTVTVPANATGLRFKGQRWVESAEVGSTVYDKLTFEILAATGETVLESIGGSPVFTNATTTTTWTAFDFPVTGNYAGQTVRLRLRALTDILNSSSFFIDTIALEATVCQ